MLVQFNTDHNLPEDQRSRNYFIDLITAEMKKFSEHITRIEVHLSDENGDKEGPGDKRCLLEARIKNQQPIVAINNSSRAEQAIEGAIEKLKHALESHIGRARDH